jgi:hypothetical protein
MQNSTNSTNEMKVKEENEEDNFPWEEYFNEFTIPIKI